MPMDGLPTNLPKEHALLLALLQQQQTELEQQRLKHEKHLAQSEKKNEQLQKRVQSKNLTIEKLEERLHALLVQQYGKRSERFNPDQLSLLNEAEIIAEDEPDQTDSDESHIDVKPHKRRCNNQRKPIPEHLARVEVHHELDEQERQCHCGATLERIGEDVHEQLSIVPRQYFVERHIRARYACACKACAKSAAVPAHPLPGAQVTPVMVAHTMVSKLLDGLPLYRQEKQAAREGLELPRAKLARWFINGSIVFQPIINRFMDTFFSHDIALCDDTRIRVLKTEEHNPNTQSALWIRRGGPPDKPVVLVDYAPSKSGEVAYGLLSEFHGTLVCDGATNFNLSVRSNKLKVALCNDHARRRFNKVHQKLSKEKKNRSTLAIASQGLVQYNKLYAIERKIKAVSAEERLRVRQTEAIPLWKSFIKWAEQKRQEGVRHAGTADALDYLIKHAKTLQTYCHDERLPISNIQSEHVAKTIAVARKNFLFADTLAGAESSGRVFSLIETARANNHNPQKYLSVLLADLPNVKTVDEIDALLPWTITPEAIAERYAAFPAP